MPKQCRAANRPFGTDPGSADNARIEGSVLGRPAQVLQQPDDDLKTVRKYQSPAVLGRFMPAGK
jgi:hypothetical protein